MMDYIDYINLVEDKENLKYVDNMFSFKRIYYGTAEKEYIYLRDQN